MEFMPLSKRINNLHINNSLLMDRSQGPPQTAPINIAEWGPGPPYYQESAPVQNMPQTPPEEVQSWNQRVPQYTPDLNERENPYYYNINKLLFEMYIERSQRNGNL